MKAQAKRIWNAMDMKSQALARRYYCNLTHQIHHNCEHGGKDLGGLKMKSCPSCKGYHFGKCS